MSKTLFITAAAVALISTSAMAGDYVGVDFSRKDKSNVTEYHNVIGMTYGHSITAGQFKNVTLEGRMEDEMVSKPSKKEGLVQVKASYAPEFNFYGVRPYFGGGVGYKSKSTLNFPYYTAELGAKYTVPYFDNRLDLKAAARLRSPFGQDSYHEGDELYRTVETSAGASYKVDKHNSVSVKAAVERGDSHYHTVNVGYAHSF